MTTQPLLARAAARPAMPRRHRRLLGVFAALVLQTTFVTPAPAEESDPVVARVNGAEIRASDVAIAEEDVGANLSAGQAAAKHDDIVKYLIDTVLVAQAAETRKLPEGDDFKRRLAYFRNKLLMEQLLQSDAKAAITDEALHKLYDDAVKQMKGEKEVHARHILVETEDEAKAIEVELKAGADFAELAKKKSKDPGAADGGDLGYFGKDQMVPEFAEVAFKLQKGQISDPVKTQFGWHIIKVEDIRERPVPEFDKVKDQLVTYLTRRAQVDLITKLRADAKIERLDTKPDAPGKAAPVQPAAPK